MRADRLLSIMMLLQARGRMTAQELSVELEVSERTIYRDVEALCTSGVPVYTERGPGGGYALLDSYRTNLTGMTEDELRALFMLSVPAPLKKLGVSQELRSALLKLSAALPGEHRRQEERMQQRFVLDWDSFGTEEPVPHLGVLQQGVWQDRRVLLTHMLPYGARVENTTVDPLGLVAKAGDWYLVAARAGRPVVYRIASLVDVTLTDQTFTRQAGFDLSAFWQAWCLTYDQERRSYLVTLRLAPSVVSMLNLYFGHAVREKISQAGPPDADGWITAQLPFASLEEARGRLLALGSAVDVLEPEALRCSLVDFAQQIDNFYHEKRNG